jgi:low affinity Fe/Cu permease
MKEAFRRFAKAAADAVGSPAAFLLGVLGVLVWLATGPYFHYSDTWQLIVNSGTSVGAFLVVFLIQNTQSRETKVMQLKLDELIRAQKHARTELVQMESCTDDELEELQKEFLQHRDEAITSLERIEQSRRRRIERTAIITPDEMPRS